MMAPIIVVAGVLALIVAHPVPQLKSTQELATWSKCKPAKIARYLGAQVEYPKHIPAEQLHVWPGAEQAIGKNKADCKGHAEIAADTLELCGHEARVLVVQRWGHRKRHAVTIYTDKKTGRRGVVNYGDHASFKPGTDWQDVIYYGIYPYSQWSIAENK